jgi:IPT/TIG domain
MSSCLINSRKPFPWVRIGFVAVLTLTLSGWTCTSIAGFNSCLGVPAPPRIVSLSPNAIPATTDSVLLIVTGSDFVAQSQILWNRSAVPTTFVDSQHLQARITQQTFDQFGGSFGSSVLISVNSPVTATVVGCPIATSSATLVLVIN